MLDAQLLVKSQHAGGVCWHSMAVKISRLHIWPWDNGASFPNLHMGERLTAPTSSASKKRNRHTKGGRRLRWHGTHT